MRELKEKDCKGVRFLTVKIKRCLSFVLAMILSCSAFWTSVSFDVKADDFGQKVTESIIPGEDYIQYWNSSFVSEDGNTVINGVPAGSAIFRIENLSNVKGQLVFEEDTSDMVWYKLVMVGHLEDNKFVPVSYDLIYHATYLSDGYTYTTHNYTIDNISKDNNYIVVSDLKRYYADNSSLFNYFYDESGYNKVPLLSYFIDRAMSLSDTAKDYQNTLGKVIHFSNQTNNEKTVYLQQGMYFDCNGRKFIDFKLESSPFSLSNVSDQISVDDDGIAKGYVSVYNRPYESNDEDINKCIALYSVDVSEHSMREPEFCVPEKDNLPTDGLVFDFGSQDIDGAYLNLKFNPNGDKSLNTQPDYYNDSAVTLIAYGGTMVDGKFVLNPGYDKSKIGTFTAYPDSNSVDMTWRIPLSNDNSCMVLEVFPGGYDRLPPDYTYSNFTLLSAKYNFTYEFSISDSSGRVIQAYTKDGGDNISVDKNYVSGGTLNSTGACDGDIGNISDRYALSVSEKKGSAPTISESGIDITGGLQLNFTYLPVGFDYSDIDVKLSLADDISKGNSAFGYSKYLSDISLSGHTEGLSKYLGGSVLDYSLYYTKSDFNSWTAIDQRVHKAESLYQPRIGFGSDRQSSVRFKEFSYRGEWTGTVTEPIDPISYDRFAIIPESYYYNFNYSISCSNSNYKLEIISKTDGVQLEEKDGVYSSKTSVNSENINKQVLEIKVLKADESGFVKPTVTKSGFYDYGLLFDESELDGSVYGNGDKIGTVVDIKSTSNDTLSFATDAYIPSDYADLLKYWCDSKKVFFAFNRWYESDMFPNELDLSSQYTVFATYIDDVKLKNGESMLISANSSGLPDVCLPAITEISYADYREDDPLCFIYNDKCYKVDAVNRRDSYGDTDFTVNGVKYDNAYNYDAIYPKIQIRPVVPGTNNVPNDYSFEYRIKQYNRKTCNFSGVKIWDYDEFEGSNHVFYPEDGGTLLNTYNSFSSDKSEISKNGTKFNLVEMLWLEDGEYETNLGISLQKLLDFPPYKSDDQRYWIDEDTGEYTGTFYMNNVDLGLLITADDIDNISNGKLPYLNIDVYLNEGSFDSSNSYKSTDFYAVFGEIQDDKFIMKKPYDGDWSTFVTQHSYTDWQKIKRYDVYNMGVMSNKYKYTLHTHLNKGESLFIIPANPDFSMAFNYEISVRNITDYNIDDVIETPVGNISREVGNNIIYKGSTESVRTTDGVQKVNLQFKNVSNISSGGVSDFEEYKNTDVRYLPARLFDYDFGSSSIAEDDKAVADRQTSDLKFLFNPQDNSNAPVNTWHNAVYPNIVKNKLSYDNDTGDGTKLGVPVFNYTTPFSNLFTISNEEDDNGNTKKSYDTRFEFSYNPDTSMYSYNSVLHSASYDEERNVILTYLASLGIDDWGMQGAGFFPFNSLQNAGKWGTADKYNLNTWLVDKDDINYHLGMALGMNFKVPSGNVMHNKDGTTSDIIYKFVGDDDVWVFVDDVLVLDMGGIHEALSGSINFTKGTYTIDGNNYNLADVSGLNFNKTSWAENTNHTVKMYYLERGGTLSNCSMQFNIPVEEEETYHVTYNGNGNDSGDVPVDDTPYLSGNIVTVKGNEKNLTRNGYDFVGFAKTPDASVKDVIKTFEITEDTVLYAVWKPKYKITYDLNTDGKHTSGDAPSDNGTYSTGDKTVVKDGKNLKMFVEGTSGAYAEFAYWTTKPDGSGEKFEPGSDIVFEDSDITLYAQWEFNVIDVELPETGSSVMLVMLIAAGVLIGIGIILWRRSGKSKSK